MKLSDPFNRVESRNSAHYRSFRESLEAAGVKTVQDIDLVSRRTTQKVWVVLVVLVCINLAAFLLFPNLAAMVLVLSVVVLLWLGTTVLRARSFLQRYRRELGNSLSTVGFKRERGE